MSEYALYLAAVLLVVASIVATRLTFDQPDNRAIPRANIEHASDTRSSRSNRYWY